MIIQSKVYKYGTIFIEKSLVTLSSKLSMNYNSNNNNQYHLLLFLLNSHKQFKPLIYQCNKINEYLSTIMKMVDTNHQES